MSKETLTLFVLCCGWPAVVTVIVLAIREKWWRSATAINIKAWFERRLPNG